MNPLSQAAPRPGLAPLALGARPLTVQIAAVLLGTLILAISSQISVPMIPAFRPIASVI